MQAHFKCVVAEGAVVSRGTAPVLQKHKGVNEGRRRVKGLHLEHKEALAASYLSVPLLTKQPTHQLEVHAEGWLVQTWVPTLRSDLSWVPVRAVLPVVVVQPWARLDLCG